MIRRFSTVSGVSGASAVSAVACALIALSSCATFDQNDVAAKIDGRSLTAKNVEALAETRDTAATGDQLREQLTKWIRVTALETAKGIGASAAAPNSADLDARLAIASSVGDQAETMYAEGLTSSPVICLAAITVTSIDEANNVLATLASGTSFADAASQFSSDTVIKEAGGVVKDENGNECLDPATVNPLVTAALADAAVGQPVAADLDTFSAVLMLRPYDDLLPESKTAIANASLPQEQLTAMVAGVNIYVDPRYGRWDPVSASVVTLTS